MAAQASIENWAMSTEGQSTQKPQVALLDLCDINISNIVLVLHGSDFSKKVMAKPISDLV